MTKPSHGLNELQTLEESEKSKTEKIRDFVHDELKLTLRELYEMQDTHSEKFSDPHFAHAYNVLGIIGLTEQVKKDIEFETQTNMRAGGPFREMWKRYNQDKLGEGSNDKAHIKGLAESQARKIWSEYLNTVHKEKFGSSITFGNRGITEADLFVDEK